MYAFLLDTTAKLGNKKDLLKKIRQSAAKQSVFGANFALSDENRAGQEISSFVKQVKKDYQTIIVVGDDWTLESVINEVHSQQADITLGFIPIDKNSHYAELLNIKGWKQAVQILPQRRTVGLNLCSINNELFIDQAKLRIINTSTDLLPHLKFQFDDKLTVKASTVWGIRVINNNLWRTETLDQYQRNLLVEGYGGDQSGKIMGTKLLKRLNKPLQPQLSDQLINIHADKLEITIRNGHFHYQGQELSVNKLTIGESYPRLNFIVPKKTLSR
ncbi:hypothetical protein KA531_00255 [Candidatus Saccharibacteria bacterium]|nr:hypothetical protein [Candidatus Saccharibacteria bacterium]